MNKATLFCLMALAGASTSHGLVNLGEGRIDLDLKSSAFYDTEIRARDLGEEDFILSLRPSLIYTRPSRSLDISASLSARAVAYLDNDQYNDTDLFLDVDVSPNASVQTDRFRFSGDVNLSSESRSDADVGQIVTIRSYRASGQLVYDPNRRLTLVATAGANRRDPEGGQYFSVTTYSASGSVQTPLNESLNLFGSIGADKVSSDGNSTNSKVFTYSAGFSGTLFSKLTGSASAGIQARHFKHREDETSPYFSANLNWRVNETNAINLNASQSVGTTIDDRATETVLIVLGARRDFNRRLSGRIFAEYQDITYKSGESVEERSDEVYSLGASVTYDWVRDATISLEASYSDRTSTTDFFSYDRLRMGISVSKTW